MCFELFLVVAELSAEFFGVLPEFRLGHELGGDVLAVGVDSRPSPPLIPRHHSSTSRLPHPMMIIKCLQTATALPLKLLLKPPKRLLLIPIVHHLNPPLLIFQDWLRQCRRIAIVVIVRRIHKLVLS